MEGFGAGMVFRQMAYSGDHDAALAILDEKRTRLPLSGETNMTSSWLMLALVIEGLVMLGEQGQAGQLYPLARELVGTGAVALFPLFRFTNTIAGVAAQRQVSGKPLKTIFKSQCSRPSPFPTASSRRRYVASAQ